MTGDYDRYFRIYTSIYFDHLVAWPWFKALAMAESSLRPEAVSQAGARGIMQLMPETFSGIGRRLALAADPFDPGTSIHFGIHYCRRLWNIFRREEGIERLRFVFAAYNAGHGNIIRAQKLAVDTGMRPDRWAVVGKALDRVTGEKNARQTRAHVSRIERIRLGMIGA